jgi:hypothetical protein
MGILAWVYRGNAQYGGAGRSSYEGRVTVKYEASARIKGKHPVPCFSYDVDCRACEPEDQKHCDSCTCEVPPHCAKCGYVREDHEEY